MKEKPRFILKRRTSFTWKWYGTFFLARLLHYLSHETTTVNFILDRNYYLVFMHR